MIQALETGKEFKTLCTYRRGIWREPSTPFPSLFPNTLLELSTAINVSSWFELLSKPLSSSKESCGKVLYTSPDKSVVFSQ
jgi:hypothetical protein